MLLVSCAHRVEPAPVTAPAPPALPAGFVFAEPLACAAPEGSCLERVRALDGMERASTTGREAIELAFPHVRGVAGIAIGSRATARQADAIEVQLEIDGEWHTIGELHASGGDVHVVPLPAGSTGERVRLWLAHGGWRIDYVALATQP